jgi:hypothetical protein
MSENEMIDASYRVTLDELFSAHTMAMKVLNSRRPWLLRLRRGYKVVMVFVAVMVLLCLAVSLLLGIDSPIMYYAVVWLLIMVGFVFGMPLVIKRLLRRRFKSTPALDKEIQFLIDAEGVKLRIEGLSESAIKWPGYLRVARTEKGFLFFQNDQVYNWLPIHAFSSDRDEDAVATLASLHAVEYVDLTR